MPAILISPQCLFEDLNNPDVVILDCSFYENPSYRQEYHQRHIPNALFFDIDDCASKESPNPHTLPSAQEFSQFVENLGISNSTHVICYDTINIGLYSAPRVWFMFYIFGHKNVSVLDGGLQSWIKCGFPVTDVPSTTRKGTFKSVPQAEYVTFEKIMENYNSGTLPLVDTRSVGRFTGVQKQSVVGIKPGHIKGSLNLPFTEFINLDSGRMKSREEVEDIFDSYGIKPEDPFYYMCSSGWICFILRSHCLHDSACSEDFLPS